MKQMDFHKDIIETKLNIRISDLVKHKVDNLNELENVHIERARSLGEEQDAAYYLNLLITDDNSRHLRGFVRDVIMNGKDHRSWRKRNVLLLLSCSLRDVLTTTRKTLFNRSDDEFTQVISPDLNAWNQHSDTSGTFAFHIPDANYKTVAPKGYILRSPDGVQLVDISPDQATIRFRRWIASRIAAYLKFHNQLNASPDLAVLDQVTPRENWTEDAHRALNGLLQELEKNSWDGESVPGFSGPDDFYD
jgi:hypothetical protein